MAQCQICGEKSNTIAGHLGVCLSCIRNDFSQVWPLAQEAHWRARQAFKLPLAPPKSRQTPGRACRFCVNECQIPQGEVGYCGLRKNQGGKILGGTAESGNVSWYYDPLPTNCVADWVCPGGTGSGYSRYAHCPGPEYGFKNLAVFYQACSFDCLFCQNWHFRTQVTSGKKTSATSLAAQVDGRTSCICYFGGDPTPQLAHAIAASRLALKNNKGRILRICWESNGSMHPGMLKEVARLSLESGGCIKFDLKAYEEKLHLILCGVTNKRTQENFASLAEKGRERPSPPFLIASTLLVPGYVDVQEVERIARFIASLDVNIPYALLAFYPHFFMADLPPTSRSHALACREAAVEAGLKNVRIGNLHLLGKDY